jgi:hypothetical protein
MQSGEVFTAPLASRDSPDVDIYYRFAVPFPGPFDIRFSYRVRLLYSLIEKSDCAVSHFIFNPGMVKKQIKWVELQRLTPDTDKSQVGLSFVKSMQMIEVGGILRIVRYSGKGELTSVRVGLTVADVQ